jgi:hypothetical protein
MRRYRLTFLIRVSAGLGLLLWCLPSYAQNATRLDVGQCFSPVLVTHAESNVVMNYQYLFLSLIDQHNYDQIKANTSATALLPVGLFSGDFNYFQSARKDYFEFKSENINFYLARSDDVSFLPTEWKSTIDNCINGVLRSPQNVTGLAYFSVDLDPYKVRLELKYYSSEPNTAGPRIRLSKITDGYLVDEKTGARREQLYRDCYTSWFDFTCPTTDAQSEFTIYRSSPNAKVSVALNAIGISNFNKSIGIEIEPLPKKRECKVVDEEKSTAFKTDQIEIHNAGFRTGKTYDSGKEEKAVFKITTAIAGKDKFPGKVTDARCITPDPGFVWVMDPRVEPKFPATLQSIGMNGSRDPDWTGNEVTCAVMTNTGDPRWVIIEGHYTPAVMKCTDVDWEEKKK